MSSFMSLCSPALLYLIIAIIALVSMIYSKVPMQTVAMKGLFVAIYTWFLNFLCSKGHSGISWFLVILPFVVMALFILAMSNIIGGKLGQQKEMFSNGGGDPNCQNPMSPGCPMYCEKNPMSPGCPMYCEKNPMSPRCPMYCEKNPKSTECNDFYSF